MFKTKNGYTVESMIAKIRERNNGTISYDRAIDRCLYRQDASNVASSNCCAAGCFIPNALYCTDLESSVWSGIVDLLMSKPELLPHMPLEPVAMERLQRIHDGIPFLSKADVRDVLENWIRDNVVD